jgi:hypothetical protein
MLMNQLLQQMHPERYPHRQNQPPHAEFTQRESMGPARNQ